MKKTFLAFAFIAFSGTIAFSQTTQTATEETKSQSSIEFVKETHDFGNLVEGDAAEAEFTFKNTGKEPLILQNVRPACGCTSPYWSKDPVAPGETGVIKAAYGTKGRPGAFNKSITVNSSAGTNVIWIKGNVEKAPANSAPKNTSLIKTN